MIDATKAYYLKAESLKSPMGGNTAAFSTEEGAAAFAAAIQQKAMTWDMVNQ
jgi:nitrous oxide reductase accessory protein NosL